jgi:hypothetical protein
MTAADRSALDPSDVAIIPACGVLADSGAEVYVPLGWRRRKARRRVKAALCLADAALPVVFLLVAGLLFGAVRLSTAAPCTRTTSSRSC